MHVSSTVAVTTHLCAAIVPKICAEKVNGGKELIWRHYRYRHLV